MSERGLACDALSVVLEVGLRALGQREVLIALRCDGDELIEIALDLGGVAAVVLVAVVLAASGTDAGACAP